MRAPNLHADGTPPETQPVVDAEDGRRARRDRNRDAVVDALLTLYKEGKLNPSSDEIATRAGLSPRSLFRYFDDIDDLCQAAISRQQSQVRHLFDFEVPPDLTLSERIDLVVDHRVRLFDTVSAAALVARLRAPFQPIVAAEISESRTYFRNQLKRAFKPELAALTPNVASSVIAAIDVLCSFESFHLLRHDQCLSKTKIISTLTDTITTLLQAAT
jgi:AcrR family transcriptional regulator